MLASTTNEEMMKLENVTEINEAIEAIDDAHGDFGVTLDGVYIDASDPDQESVEQELCSVIEEAECYLGVLTTKLEELKNLQKE